MPGRAVRAHDASVFMRPRLGSRGGTFTDAAGRLKDVLLSIRSASSGADNRAWADCRRDQARIRPR